nr:hypothetical protein [Cytophagales bacterium]
MSLSLYLVSIFLGLAGGSYYALTKFKNGQQSGIQLLLLGIIGFVACFELYAIYLYKQGKHNVLVYNICFFYIETFLLLAYLYGINVSKKTRQFIVYFCCTYLAWGIINTVFIQDIQLAAHSYSFLIASLGIVSFCLLFIFQIAKNNEFLDKPLWSIPHFWNTSILLIFYSSAFLYFISLNVLVELDLALVKVLGSFNRFVAGTMYIVLGFSFFAPMFQPTNHG